MLRLKQIGASLALAMVLASGANVTAQDQQSSAKSQNNAQRKDWGEGTWELNVEKSKFSGLPAPKSQTIQVMKSSADQLEWTATTVAPDGQSVTESWSGKPDGTMQPVKSDNTSQASFRWKKDSLIANMKNKQGITIREEIQMSPDGKTMTIKRTVNGPDGKTGAVAVYDRK